MKSNLAQKIIIFSFLIGMVSTEKIFSGYFSPLFATGAIIAKSASDYIQANEEKKKASIILSGWEDVSPYIRIKNFPHIDTAIKIKFCPNELDRDLRCPISAGKFGDNEKYILVTQNKAFLTDPLVTQFISKHEEGHITGNHWTKVNSLNSIPEGASLLYSIKSIGSKIPSRSFLARLVALYCGTKLPIQAIKASVNRQFELKADEHATQFYRNSPNTIHAGKTFFTEHEEVYPDDKPNGFIEELLATHPSAAERIANINRIVAQEAAKKTVKKN